MYQVLKTFIPTVTNMIRADHTHVLATFHQYEIDTAPGTKRALVNTICAGLEIHAQLEEEVFYPAMREVSGDAGVVGKSVPEHDEMRRLIARLREMEPEDAGYDATVMELMRDVLHHVADEETILLTHAESVMGDSLMTLGRQMTMRRLQLKAQRTPAMVGNAARTAPGTSLVMTAGALLAGAMLFRRFRRHV